jgi:hypothetical protein
MLNSLLFGIMLTGFVAFMAWLAYDAFIDIRKHNKHR